MSNTFGEEQAVEQYRADEEQQLRKTKDLPKQQMDDSAEPSTRPRRTIRRSVIFTSGEYETNFPGTDIIKEEDEKVTEEEDEGVGLAGLVPKHEETSAPREEFVVQKVEEQLSRPPPSKRERRRPPKPVEGEAKNSEELRPIQADNLPQEVDVETVSPLKELEHEAIVKDHNYEEENASLDDSPPVLERVKSIIGQRKRGRPRKQDPTPFRCTNAVVRRSSTVRDPTVPVIRNTYSYEKPLTKLEATMINSFNVKLFDDDIGVTEHGDVYATVIPGCLSTLLRREKIVELLTNSTEIDAIREAGWIQNKPPRLPPLTTQKACFAFYIDGAAISSIRDISADDLRPWTTSSNDITSHREPVVKPNVRRHLIIREGSKLVPVKGVPRGSELHLTEYSAWLPRCLRLRKKIYYLAQSGQLVGNVLILYDFTANGEVPTLLNVVHGGEAFRGSHTDAEFEKGHLLFVGDNENPFEEEMVEGPQGGRYFRVQPDRYGWTNNKRLLLRWLVNEPQLATESGALNRCIPYLPPMITDRGVYVYFAPASLIAEELLFTGDGLSPWTFRGAGVNHRVRTVKRGLVQDASGFFMMSRQDWQMTGLALVESITILCRQPRLRKRIIYVQGPNSVIIGNVCYIYEYMQPGALPQIVKVNNRASFAGERQMNRTHPDKSPLIMLPDDDDNVDVEELLGDIVDDVEELPEDSLHAGWDTDFEEDVLVSNMNKEPFFAGVRHLMDGHSYLTVRHKRLLCSNEVILEYIINSDYVEDTFLVNTSKPNHPPLVHNARAYAFFVNGQAIYPGDINRDDFSPWSANATPDRPTSYRSKVRKYGVKRDPLTMTYVVQEGDYKLYPYHLVSLYCIHPKEARLRKRIHYVMETGSKAVISHVMIIYDYTQEGPIPRLNGPYVKKVIGRRGPFIRLMGDTTTAEEVLEELPPELDEVDRTGPFAEEMQPMDNGEVYMVLDDIEFS